MIVFVYYNANKDKKIVGDCVVRAISTLLNQDWDTTYLGIVIQGYIDADMPSGDSVWGNYLRYKGYDRYIIPSVCPDCMTVKDFCTKYPKGRYLLALGNHVVACIYGDYYDTWDSGDKTVIYYYAQRERPD